MSTVPMRASGAVSLHPSGFTDAALPDCRCHIIQSGLRPSGGTGYSIPRGFLFEYVTCANYCAEIYGWVAFTVGTQTVAPGIFILCGGAQMAIWAAGKHARLRKVRPGWCRSCLH